MDLKTMKKSHEVQIKALLKGDYDAFKGEFSERALREPFDGIDNHHSAWGYTGGQAHSLFGNLPNAMICLTQVKNHPEDSEWHDILGLGNNHLIPTNVQEDTVLTEDQLREFSRLQLEANFSEEVT